MSSVEARLLPVLLDRCRTWNRNDAALPTSSVFYQRIGLTQEAAEEALRGLMRKVGGRDWKDLAERAVREGLVDFPGVMKYFAQRAELVRLMAADEFLKMVEFIAVGARVGELPLLLAKSGRASLLFNEGTCPLSSRLSGSQPPDHGAPRW